jgi:hypothetical protein
VLATSAGADTFRVEIDYMADNSVGGHSHEPTTAELNAVIQMFACQGHTLIIDLSDEIPHHDVLQMDPAQNWRIFAYSGVPDSYGALKNEFYDHAGVSGWHYCIFGHQYEWSNTAGVRFDSGSSGLAEISGDDLIVTLGTFLHAGVPGGSPFEKASTLAHEFGHNLGLMHCGDMNCYDEDDPDWVDQYPLNVASVMSYFYQMVGVRNNLVCQGLAPEFIPFKDIDYSHGSMCSLDEEALDEGLGTMMASADWNCDGGIDPGTLRADLNGGSRNHWCGPDLISGVRSVLSDLDEWGTIADMTKSLSPEKLTNLDVIVCISDQEMQRFTDKVVCPQPTLVTEPCVTAEMRYVRADGRSGARGDCSDAFDSISGALAGAPDGSVIILEPLVWNAGGQVFQNKAIFISAESAVLR